MRSTPDSTNWWADLYDDQLADVLLADTCDVDDTVTFLINELRLERGDRVFDQCCGTGRLSVPLATWGAEVIGVEQAARYVERARASRSSARFEIGDAFEFVVERPCRGAFNWWTSFGYLPDDDANVRMLQRAFESLAPGGRYALDFPNAANVHAAFRPHEVTRKHDILMVRESELDVARGLLHKRWTFVTGERRVERRSVLRLYLPDQLAGLFARAGFVDVRMFGGVDGASLALDRARCIVVGERR